MILPRVKKSFTKQSRTTPVICVPVFYRSSAKRAAHVNMRQARRCKTMARGAMAPAPKADLGRVLQRPTILRRRRQHPARSTRMEAAPFTAEALPKHHRATASANPLAPHCAPASTPGWPLAPAEHRPNGTSSRAHRDLNACTPPTDSSPAEEERAICPAVPQRERASS